MTNAPPFRCCGSSRRRGVFGEVAVLGGRDVLPADANRQRRYSPRFIAILAGLVVLYALAYIVISRLGYATADEYQLEGFYYVFPENTDT